MFTTRTIARAPVAGRLAGSVSTLRVASLSAFTSGSKLAGFFGRASGQTSAPAFQQLRLRMSLSRAFSSQTPIKKLSDQEMIELGMSYTGKRLKEENSEMVQYTQSLISKDGFGLHGTDVYRLNSTLGALGMILGMKHQRSCHLIAATRDYRLQLLKEQGLEAYFDEVNRLGLLLEKVSDLTHAELQQELGVSPMIFLDSVAYYTSTDNSFLMQVQDFENRFIRRKFNQGTKPILEPSLMSSEAYTSQLIAYAKECKNLPRDRAQKPFARRIYVDDRLFQDTGFTMQKVEAGLDLQDTLAKKRYAMFTAAVVLDFD